MATTQQPAAAPMTFFLDESGSTGDVVRTGRKFNFGGQPIFTLTAIGIAEPYSLDEALARVARSHGLMGGEIKSAALVRNPGFAADLAEELAVLDCPVFIEVMDKRYLIVTNVLNHILLPPIPGFDDRLDGHDLREVVAEIVHQTIPDAVLARYAAACEAPSRAAVAGLMDDLRTWAADLSDMGGTAPTLRELVDDAAKEFEADDLPDAHLRRLPLPDASVTGRAVSMLPALSALTNVYARINKYRAGALATVELVHDEHMLHGCILSEAKVTMERLSAEGAVPEVRHADYRLREHATLAFRGSVDTPGIQAADVIGGFVMRFVRDFLFFRRPDAARDCAMEAITALSVLSEARGLNFVMARRDMMRMGIDWS